MYGSHPRLYQLAAPILLAVAIVGYLAGHRHVAATPTGAHPAGIRIAYGTGVLLEYPSEWRQTPAAAAPAIPGLPIIGPLLLAPGGNGAGAGLLSGQLPATQTTPLPGALMAQLRGLPHTEVMELFNNTQAYRYSKLNLQGYALTLQLYSIPSSGNRATVLACYASKELSSYLSQCQRIVAGLTLVGNAPTDLAPEAGYAAALDRLIGTLNQARAETRKKMSARATPSALGRLAGELASRFEAAAASLAALQPPPPAGPAQAALTSAILHSQHAYQALAQATEGRGGYAAAQAQVPAAETGLDTALQSYALLGYGQA